MQPRTRRKGVPAEMNRRRFMLNALALSAAQTALRGFSLPRPGSSHSNPYIGLDLKKAKALEEQELARSTLKIDALLAAGPFKPNWESLHSHVDADWFRDAKFGIYTHWTPVTVGCSFSPGDAEWYGNQMYKPDHAAFEYHKKTFGDQHAVGYKDIIPKFTGERFDADRWAKVVVQSGAK